MKEQHSTLQSDFQDARPWERKGINWGRSEGEAKKTERERKTKSLQWYAHIMQEEDKGHQNSDIAVHPASQQLYLSHQHSGIKLNICLWQRPGRLQMYHAWGCVEEGQQQLSSLFCTGDQQLQKQGLGQRHQHVPDQPGTVQNDFRMYGGVMVTAIQSIPHCTEG